MEENSNLRNDINPTEIEIIDSRFSFSYKNEIIELLFIWNKESQMYSYFLRTSKGVTNFVDDAGIKQLTISSAYSIILKELQNRGK